MFSLLQHGSISFKTIVFLLLWVSTAHAELKNVFFHYMVTGLTPDQASQDVKDAKAIGVDAFALNLEGTTEQWSVEAVSALFEAANANDFKLFFSFDMTWFTSPSQFIPYLIEYIANPAYYMHDGLPFVSTFYGGTMTFGQSTPNEGWETDYVQALAGLGHTTYFVPAFSDSVESSGKNFYNSFPSVNGAFSWSCWPEAGTGNQTVTTTIDQAYLSSRPTNKTYMMGLSPVQFKHLSSTQNWYRSGSGNMLDRIPQILDLSPDFLEVITWNDNGESHYFGNVWNNSDPAAYSMGYDHSGWQALIPTLVQAYKAGTKDVTDLVPMNGQDVQGAFWHHTLLSTADCSDDDLGKPDGIDDVQDLISIALYASGSAGNLTMNAWSGGALVKSEPVVKGYNSWTSDMKTGSQYVEVVDGNSNVLFSGTGTHDVVSESSVCNYNFQVVELSAAAKGTATKRDGQNKLSRSKHTHEHRHRDRIGHLHRA